jgi:CSLREA domain-containing protein
LSDSIQTPDNLNVVLIDDSLIIRHLLKSVLARYLKGHNLNIFSSANGVEGLGYVMVSNPDVVIIDSTLPKYSGKELVEYLVSNEHLRQVGLKVIVLHEGHSVLYLPPQYVILNKLDREFVPQLLAELNLKSGETTTLYTNVLSWLSRRGVKLANKSDLIMHKREYEKSFFVRTINLAWWTILQFRLSFILSFLRLLGNHSIQDANLPQQKEDDKYFRVKTYPTLATVGVAVIFALLQVLLFVVGGVTLFHFLRFESVFALAQNEKGYEFNTSTANQYEFNPDEVEFTNDGVSLKAHQVVVDENPSTTPEPTNNPSVTPSEIPTTEPTNTPEPTSTPEATSTPEPTVTHTPTPTAPVSFPAADVQGISDEQGVSESTPLSANSTTKKYSTDKPFLVTKNNISYATLKDISERSSINNDESSTDKNFKNKTNTDITYQLSPNGTDWYYWNVEENRWAKTVQSEDSSNNIQSVNEHLDSYETAAGAAGTIYLKIFLSSNGSTTPILKEIVIEREVKVVDTVDQTLPAEPTITEEVVGSVDFDKLEVEMFNASYFNGNKIVKGKLLLKNKKVKGVYQIGPEELALYEARVYYSDAKKATKGALIGTADLKLNEQGEIEFLVEQPSTPGGYVTAEVVLKELVYPDSYPTSFPIVKTEGKGSRSELASPIENSTFTVDSTGDGADAATNGLCADSGGKCTLRAAIAEANAAVGPHNIYFNIPTSDAGYRDFDLESTASSGDSIGGDDFWTIQPTTTLPSITAVGVHIDGATQTTNQGDFNTSGPEIQFNADAAGEVNCFIFTSASTNSSMNSMIVNRCGAGATSVHISGDGFVLTNSYIGTNAKGTAGYSGGTNSGYGVVLNQADATIGHTVSDGNVISGNINYGIYDACGNQMAVSTATIAGNKIGLGVDGSYIANDQGIFFEGDCSALLGGNTAANRNYVVGPTRAIRTNIYADPASHLQLYNNFIGTDLTGTQNRGGGAGMTASISAPVRINTSGLQPIDFGAAGKGNLIRFVTDALRMNTGSRDLNFEYNTIGDTGNTAMLLSDGSSAATLNINVTHNSIGRTAADPYFGLAMGIVPNQAIYIAGPDPSSSIHIDYNTIYGSLDGINSFPPAAIYNNDIRDSRRVGVFTYVYSDIKGNILQNNTYYGIITYPPKSNRTASYLTNTFGRIGGTSSFAGSKCNGKAQNCISGNLKGGIFLNDQPFLNESTMFIDNDFGSGNGITNNTNVELAWLSMFEIFTGTNRRTDLATDSVRLRLPSTNTFYTYTGGDGFNTLKVQEIKNKLANCITSSDCPTSGASSGTSGKTMVFAPQAANLSNTDTWLKSIEYTIDNSGLYHYGSAFKIDTSHFATTDTFTFDGNSTTNPVTTDLGEPWTSNTTATRNLSTASYGQFQIPQLQLVDANPERQADGTYVITIDSAGSEDNVSSVAYDDGFGAYSGGGLSGPSGQANGITSLTEAQYVAAHFSGTVKFQYSVQLTSPINNADVPTTSPVTFQWGSSLDPQIAYYEVYAGTNIDALQLQGRTASTETNMTVNIIPDLVFRTYYWKVVGKRADGSESGSSPVDALDRIRSAVGLNALVPDLNIGKSAGTQEVVRETNPPDWYTSYGANVTNIGSNGCLPNSEGITDIGPLDSYTGTSRVHDYSFTFSPDVTIKNFSFYMLDYGDFMPFGTNADHTYWYEAIAYDANGNVVDTDRVQFTTPDGSVNGRNTPEFGNLSVSGDACTSTDTQPGHYKFSLQGKGITRITARFRDTASTDPNMALSIPSFTIEDYPITLVYPSNGAILDTRTPQLDWNPSQSSDGRVNPGVTKYAVYIDGVKVGETTSDITQLLLTTPLSQDVEHSWYVVALRSNGQESGRSETWKFTIPSTPVTNYTFDPVYPVNVTIDDDTPLFDWTDIDPASDADVYDLYIDGVLIQKDIPIGQSYYQLGDKDKLKKGDHEWQVISYKVDQNGVRTEVGRTILAKFTVEKKEKDDKDKDKDKDQDKEEVKKPDNILNHPEQVLSSSLAIPLLTSLILLLISLLTVGIGSTFKRLGVIIGILVPKKRKYWGIIYDEVENKGVPFAVVRLIKDGKVVDNTISDLEGRYGLLGHDGTFVLEITAGGYQPYTKQVSINNLRKEIIEDVALRRIDKKVNLFNRLRFYYKKEFFKLFNIFWLLVSIAGLAYSIYALVLNPVLINYLIIAGYGFIFAVNLIIVVKTVLKKIGKVVDIDTKQGISRVIVRFNTLDGKSNDIQITNEEGDIKINLKSGIYDVMASKTGYVQQEESKKANIVKGGYLETDIKMKKLDINVNSTGTASIAPNNADNPFS